MVRRIVGNFTTSKQREKREGNMWKEKKEEVSRGRRNA